MAQGLYYTQQQFIDAHGLDEALRLTDEDGAGIPDADAFTTAIADVSADIDSYLAGRYTLPLAEPVPRVITSIAAALVREKLHGTFPTDAVTRQADQARKQLGDLATGKAQLVDVGGAQPDQGVSTASGIRVMGPARVFSADKLARY